MKTKIGKLVVVPETMMKTNRKPVLPPEKDGEKENACLPPKNGLKHKKCLYIIRIYNGCKDHQAVSKIDCSKK